MKGEKRKKKKRCGLMILSLWAPTNVALANAVMDCDN